MSDNQEGNYTIKVVEGDGFRLQEYNLDDEEIGYELEPNVMTHFFDVYDVELTSELGNETETLEWELSSFPMFDKSPRLEAYFRRFNSLEGQTQKAKSIKIDQRLTAKLKTTLTKYDRSWGDPLKYFIMGSHKPIEEFALKISTTDQDEEYMVVLVNDAWEYEGETLPSRLSINVLLHKQNFDDLINSLEKFPEQKISFSCELSGAYSQYSYLSSYDVSEVKLLTEHTLDGIIAGNKTFFGKHKGFDPYHLNCSLTDKERTLDEFSLRTVTKLSNSESLQSEAEEDTEPQQELDSIDYNIPSEITNVTASSASTKEEFSYTVLVIPLWTIAVLIFLSLVIN